MQHAENTTNEHKEKPPSTFSNDRADVCFAVDCNVLLVSSSMFFFFFSFYYSPIWCFALNYYFLGMFNYFIFNCNKHLFEGKNGCRHTSTIELIYIYVQMVKDIYTTTIKSNSNN